jgi:hypothetical protein
VELACIGHDARIGGEHAVDIRVDLACVGTEGGGERNRGRVGASTAQGRHVECSRNALVTGHDRDAPLVERVEHTARANIEDASLAVRRICHYPGLRAREGNRASPELHDRHRQQRHGDAFAGG